MTTFNIQDAPTIRGGALKALGDGRVGGYLVAWGDPTDTDLEGDYFTPDTDFMFDRYPVKGHAIVLFEHAQDGTLKSRGLGEFVEVKKDDVGLWAEAVLNRADQYAAMLEEILKRKPGKLGWSSGSVPQFVVNEDGHIRRWPVVEGSITASPMQPEKTVIQPVKALTPSSLEELIAEVGVTEDSAPTEPAALKSKVSSPQEGTMATKSNTTAIIEAVLAEVGELSGEQVLRLTAAIEGAQAADVGLVNDADPELLATDVYDEAKATPVQKAAARIAIAAQKAAQAEISQQSAKRFGGYAQFAAASANPYANGTKATAPANGNGNRAQDNASWGSNGAPANIEHLALKARYGHLTAQQASATLYIIHEFEKRGMPIADVTPMSKAVLAQSAAGAAIEQAGQRKLVLDRRTAKALADITAIKANELANTTATGYGLEFVHTIWSNQMWDEARRDNVVLPLIDQFEMAADIVKQPIRGSRSTVYYVPESTDDAHMDPSGSRIPASRLGTSVATFDSKKLATRIPFSAELNEDSIIDWTQYVMSTAKDDMARTIDHTIINGDNATSGNINLDGGTPDAKDSFMAFDGILLDGLSNGVNGGGGVLTYEDLLSARFLLNREASGNMQDIVWFVSPELEAKLLNVDEFLTMDVAGPQASALTGQIGRWGGMSFVVTPVIALGAANGKISSTPGDNLYARGVVFYRPAWKLGWRRQVTSYMDRSMDGESWQITLTARLDLQHAGYTGRASTIYNVA